MASHGNTWSMGKILGVSAAAGVVVFLFLLWLLQYSGWSAFLWGLIVGVVVFLILWLNFGGEDETGAAVSGAGAASGAGATSGAGAAAAAHDEPVATAADAGAAADSGAGDASAAAWMAS